MIDERVIRQIREANENNISELYLIRYNLTQLPPEIGKLKNLRIIHLYSNSFTELPSEILELRSLTKLDLSFNKLTQLSPEIRKLKNLKILDLRGNYLTELPPEIGELEKLEILNLSQNDLTQLPSEIGKLENLIELYLSENQLTLLPPEIGELKNLKKLHLYSNLFIHFPLEITELKNLLELDLFGNQLTELPSEIGELKNLTEINLSENHLTQLPPEIGELKNLKRIYITKNYLTQLPVEIIKIKGLWTLSLFGNPLVLPPPEIVSIGIVAIFTYLEESKTTENNEAKLILVGNGEVGKTCLANRLIKGDFIEDSKITEGISISRWTIPAPGSGDDEIKLNIWDFGGQEIYHATHQFFLTKRSVYILVWNARRTRDYDHIYYWLHTIEAFGEESPIILVMSKKNESDDDLNLKDLKSKFPNIVDYLKIDSKDGKGIPVLIEKIRETAWNLPLMRVLWVDSWYRVREKLEKLNAHWITDHDFYSICSLEGLDEKNTNILDEYLHELGVILHFKDRIALQNIVILKPEWATEAFYKILSTKSVLHRGGILLHNELNQIWDKKIYSSAVYPQLMELMNKFELSFELPDRSSYLIPELLPKNEPNDLKWDKENNLCFYYCYDHYLPPGIIPRFIVRMHQDLEKKNGMPLCWREGAILQLQNSRAFVRIKPDEKLIEIRIKSENKRGALGALGAICNELDRINASTKRVKVNKEIPCNCSDNCPERYSYDKLLEAEMKNKETIQCHESFESISVTSMLDGYVSKNDRLIEYEVIARGTKPLTINNSPVINVTPQITVDASSKLDLKVDLQLIKSDLDKLNNEIGDLNSELKNELSEIRNDFNEINDTNPEKKKLDKPFSKLSKFLKKASDFSSEYYKIIEGTQKGLECLQKLSNTYNQLYPLIEMFKIQ